MLMMRSFCWGAGLPRGRLMLMMRGLFLDRRWADAHDAQLLLGRRFTQRPADADDAWSLRAGNWNDTEAG